MVLLASKLCWPLDLVKSLKVNARKEAYKVCIYWGSQKVVHILIFFVEGWANPRWKTSFGGLASGRHGTLPTFCGKVWDDGNDLSINRPVQESVSRYFFRKKVSKTFVAILFSASLYCNPCYSVADQSPSGGQIEKLKTAFKSICI